MINLEFPDMKGLIPAGLWFMRQFYCACRDVRAWRASKDLDAGHRAGREAESGGDDPILATLSRELDQEHSRLLLLVSWSHHRLIIGASSRPDERFFYLQMTARERWSVRELKRQVDSGLFLRYISTNRNPENCIPSKTEQGELLPFKDHYILDFLGLEEPYCERQIRKAMISNVRELFLELGRDFALIGEEFPITLDGDTFRIDLLLFHRRLQCLVALELKTGDVRLPHEKPSIGLVLCRSAKGVQQT